MRECRALVRRGRFESHCSRGWLMPYTLGKPSAARARTCSRVRCEGWKRAMSEPWASISLLPSVISSATMRPTPAASLIHTAAADHRPATSGVSPTRAPPSGVRESSPLSAAFRGGSGSVSRRGKSSRAWASCAVKSSSVKGKLVGLAWPGWFPTGGISLGSCSRGRCAYEPISRSAPRWRSYMRLSMSRSSGKLTQSSVAASAGIGPTSSI